MSQFCLFLGVDPGLTGCLAALNAAGEVVFCEQLPTMPLGGGYIKRRVDPRELKERMEEALCRGGLYESHYHHQALAVVENVWVRPTDGKSTGASLVQSAALCEGVLVGLGAQVIRPLPALWKGAFGLLGRGKQGSVERVRKLYPGLNQKDHNACDAILLARFGFLNRDKPLSQWDLIDTAK